MGSNPRPGPPTREPDRLARSQGFRMTPTWAQPPRELHPWVRLVERLASDSPGGLPGFLSRMGWQMGRWRRERLWPEGGMVWTDELARALSLPSSTLTRLMDHETRKHRERINRARALLSEIDRRIPRRGIETD